MAANEQKINYNTIIAIVSLIVSGLTFIYSERNYREANHKIERRNILDSMHKDSVKVFSLKTIEKYKRVVHTENKNIFVDKYYQIDSLLENTKFLDKNILLMLKTHQSKLTGWKTIIDTKGVIDQEIVANELIKLNEECNLKYSEFCQEYSINLDKDLFSKPIYYY